jgi:hypothetical protein
MKCYSSDNTNVCGGLEGPQILLIKQGTMFRLWNRGPRGRCPCGEIFDMHGPVEVCMCLTSRQPKTGNGMSDDFSDDVSEGIKELVNHAVYLRGNIITSYAHIEFLLADICLKAWQLGEYAHLAGAFPYKTDSRIKAVRALFEGEGPLKPHREGIQPALDKLLSFEELRHFVAHGLLIVTPMPPSDAMLQYRLYRTTKLGTAIAFMETSASDLDDVALEIGTLLNKMLTTFRRIYFDLGFELED